MIYVNSRQRKYYENPICQGSLKNTVLFSFALCCQGSPLRPRGNDVIIKLSAPPYISAALVTVRT